MVSNTKPEFSSDCEDVNMSEVNKAQWTDQVPYTVCSVVIVLLHIFMQYMGILLTLCWNCLTQNKVPSSSSPVILVFWFWLQWDMPWLGHQVNAVSTSAVADDLEWPSQSDQLLSTFQNVFENIVINPDSVIIGILTQTEFRWYHWWAMVIFGELTVACDYWMWYGYHWAQSRRCTLLIITTVGDFGWQLIFSNKIHIEEIAYAHCIALNLGPRLG